MGMSKRVVRKWAVVRMGGLSLHLSVRRGAGCAQKRPLWRYSDLAEWGREAGREE